MIIGQQILSNIEQLRIPFDDIYGAKDWKDWYHFVLIDLQTGLRVLANITLIGKPEAGEIQGTFIVNLPVAQIPPQLAVDSSIATFGTAFSQPWQPEMVRRSPLLIQGKGLYLEFNRDRFIVALEDNRAHLAIHFQAQAQATPLLITEDSPFGSGFIGWGLVPGLQVLGELSVCRQKFAIAPSWFCYHDRNFGRFRWGEDIGWEWFVAVLVGEDGRKFTLVLDKRTNKNHSSSGLPYIFIYEETQLRKIFLGPTLQIDWDWTAAQRPLRLPGVMASLFVDKAIKVPQALQIQARDEQDSLMLNVKFEAMTELVVPDNQARQYSFIEEVTGQAEVELSLGGKVIHAKGLIYAEYVV